MVISGVTLGGTDAGNYTLSAQPTGVTGSITKKTVTVTSGITASNKTYDGTTWATLSGSSAVISGKVTGDVLGVSASGAFANKNVGTGKTVTISSITLTGTDKGNYVLTTTSNQATTTANISKKALTVTADDKSVEYGDAAPTYTASYSGFVSGESKSNLSGSLSFSCSYTSSSKTGTYTITPSGHTSSNYNSSIQNRMVAQAAKTDYIFEGTDPTQSNVGINGVETSLNITTYPNPATEMAYIDANGETIRSYEVVNALGQKVIDEKNVNVNTIELNVSGMPQGVYFVTVATDRGMASQRLTIVK